MVSSISVLPSNSPIRDVLVGAYVSAWRSGCYALVAVAGLQLVLCLMMRRVEFNDPSSQDPSSEKSGNRTGVESVEEEPSVSQFDELSQSPTRL